VTPPVPGGGGAGSTIGVDCAPRHSKAAFSGVIAVDKVAAGSTRRSVGPVGGRTDDQADSRYKATSAAMTAADIFLSYSRQDLAVAGRMAAALSDAGFHVWWDQALTSGEIYDKVTETALREARVVVVLWSKASVASDWVRAEATVAMQRDALMPVMIETCQRPVMFELRQSADLAGWKGNADDRRLRAFLVDVGRRLDRPVAAKPIPMADTRPSRRALFGGIAAVAGIAALGTAGYFGWKSPQQGAAGADTARIAVLPFANLSGDPAQAYFSDGLAEELRSALATIPGVRVIGRTSSEKFRDADDPVAAAAKLGVDHLLTGSVRRSPTMIRISAQLIDGATGIEDWAASYERPAGDALVIQDSIATAVIGALNRRIGRGQTAIEVGGTRNPEAQALMLQGSTYPDSKVSEADYLRSVALLDKAIALDPGYAEAYRYKAIALGGVENFQGAFDAANRYRLAALAAARQGVKVRPDFPAGLATLALHQILNLDAAAGIATNNLALKLTAGNGGYTAAMTRVVNIVDPQRGLELVDAHIAFDPLDGFAHDVRGEALFKLRRFEEAAASARKAMELSNGYRGSINLGRALIMLGRFDEARRIDPREERGVYSRALLEARAGNKAAARALLDSPKMGALDPRLTHYARAQVLAQLGEREAAVTALEDALRNRDGSLTRMAFDPFVDPIRDDPRFRAVQDKVIPPGLIVPLRRG
jgi:serine/threonine-protein kinase